MLVLVRHGRTAWNAQGRFQGWADVPLDGVGVGQARQVAADLEAAVGGPWTVVSSDLSRAAATATAIATAGGTVPIIDPGLREVDVGSWEGLTATEAAAVHPVEHRMWAAGVDVRRGGGETRAEAGARVARSIGAFGAANAGALVVVGHGQSLQAGLQLLAERHLINLPGGAPHLQNAEYLVLADWRHDQAECVLSHR
jgi:broad specificity phosphatase PhoE